jgi:hypothetical protein
LSDSEAPKEEDEEKESEEKASSDPKKTSAAEEKESDPKAASAAEEKESDPKAASAAEEKESDPKAAAADESSKEESDPKVAKAAKVAKAPKEMSQSAKRRAAMPTPLDGFRVVETSWGYPAFAREFPRHPELDDLVAAFARGDYHTVREGAPKLAASTKDDRIKRAAETLRARIEPDPTSRILFAFAALLLAFLTFYWVKHSGAEGGLPQQTSPKPAKSVPTVEHVD